MSGERVYYDPCYHGTETYWRHPFGLLYTDSVRDFAETYQAYWSLDVVASYLPEIKQYEFLVIYFDVKDETCSFYCREDSDTPNVIEQYIEYTDLKVSVKLYLVDKILMFPSDY